MIAAAIALYFTYKLTKITGIFLAWSLFIAALILRASDNVIELLLDTGYVASHILELTEDIVLPFLVTILLLLFSFELYRTFKRQLKKP